MLLKFLVVAVGTVSISPVLVAGDIPQSLRPFRPPETITKAVKTTPQHLQPRSAHRVDVTIPALHWAAIEGDVDEVKLLIAAGSSVDSLETLYGGERALHWAAAGGHSGTVRELLAAGASIEATDSDGETALREALRVSDPHYLALTALLDEGADPNARDNYGWTALHEAVLVLYEGGYSAVHLLRRFGADPNTTDNARATPLHYAVTQPFDRFSGWTLMDTSADPHGRALNLNATDENGMTPLHWLVSRADSVADANVLDWLLNHDVLVNPTDEWGSTPLDWAVFAGLDDLAGKLRFAGGVTRRAPPDQP